MTYGITDEEMPTPTPAASATGSARAGAAAQPPIGVTDDRGDEHGRAEAVDPAAAAARGGAVGEHDVEREQRGVGEREGEPERLAGERTSVSR